MAVQICDFRPRGRSILAAITAAVNANVLADQFRLEERKQQFGIVLVVVSQTFEDDSIIVYE